MCGCGWPSAATRSTSATGPGPHAEESLAGALRQILHAYLPSTTPSIEWAAEVSGLSVRTLQRRLAREKLTFSRVVDRARFELARERLQDPDHRIIDIAYDTGYSDPSHFSRAFRRLAGVSPRAFRLSQGEQRA